MADNPFLASLAEAWGGDETQLGLPDFETDPFPDETLSPGMSEFVRTARRYVAGVIDDHEFVDSIQETANRLQTYLTLHRQLAGQLPLSFPQQALAHLATQALIVFSEGLSDMVAFFGRGDLPQVETGVDRCKQAIIILEAWWIELCRVVRFDTTRVCPECGAVSPAGAERCDACKQALAPVDDEFQPDQEYFDLPLVWVELYRQTREMVAGRLAASAWSAVLEERRNQVLELQSRLRDIPNWQVEPGWLPEELVEDYDQTGAGLGRLREALEEMQGYAHHQQIDALNKGWFLLGSALFELGRPSRYLRDDLLALLDDLEAELADESE